MQKNSDDLFVTDYFFQNLLPFLPYFLTLSLYFSFFLSVSPFFHVFFTKIKQNKKNSPLIIANCPHLNYWGRVPVLHPQSLRLCLVMKWHHAQYSLRLRTRPTAARQFTVFNSLTTFVYIL